MNKKQFIFFSMLFLLFSHIAIAQNSKVSSEGITNNVSINSSLNASNVSVGTDIKDETIVRKSPSLFETVQEGGILMIPLFLLLIAVLTIIIERIIFYSKEKSWNTNNFRKFLEKTAANSKSKYREVLEEELQETGKNYIHELEKGLNLLNGMGNIAPLLGFLGTVTGMIGAFAAIANASTVNAKIVASGIKEALVTTASGLIIAVPALVTYYIFINIVQSMYVSLDNQIQNLCKNKPSITEDQK